MAYTEGTLIEGFSIAAVVPFPEEGSFILNVLPGQGFDRLTRLGTVLQVSPSETPTRRQVTRVFKLFGEGLMVGSDTAALAWGASTEIWIRLFVPSMQYWIFSK